MKTKRINYQGGWMAACDTGSASTVRARIAALTRKRPPGHPELIAAYQELKLLRLRTLIEAEPPLTAAQTNQLVSALCDNVTGAVA